MRNKILVLVLLLVICMALPGCSFNKGSSGGEVSEGVDTHCEITGYTSYTERYGSYFLQEGDKVAVISPSALPSEKQVDMVVKGLKEWGFEPVLGKYVCPKTRTLEELLEDLKWALSSPEIKAVFCVRGGYGATEVLDSLTLEMIENAKKPIIGYSDITVYHCAWTVAGLPSIHACMSETFGSLAEDCKEAQLQMMKGNIPSYRCDTDEVLKSGEAEGILVGGNLSTFMASMDTYYDCTKTGEPYVLYLEDVGEDIEHIHRYLTVLDHLGVLDGASAIIFGEWTEYPPDGGGSFGMARGGGFESVADMIRKEFFSDLDIPVAFGFPAGHGDVNYPLLMGEKVHVSITDNSYILEWK